MPNRFKLPVDIRFVQLHPALPTVYRCSRRSAANLRFLRFVIHAIADHIFCVMLEGYHEIRKHSMHFPTSGVVAFMPGNNVLLTLTVILTDFPFTVISEDERAFLAHGTKVFTAVR